MDQNYQINEVDFFKRRYYKLNQICLSLIGLWPYSERNKTYFRRLIISGTFFIFFVLQITAIVKATNFYLLMEIVSNFILYLTCVFLYYNSLFNMAKISQLLKLIKQNWHEREHIEEFQIMKKYAEDGRTYSLIIISLTYGLILTAISISAIPFILDMYFPLNQPRHRTLPFPMEFFIDIQKYYFVILLITFVLSSITCTTVIGNYTLFAVLIYHICGMFCVVGNMLDGIRKEILYDRYTEDKVYEKIIRSIKYHKKTLEFYSIFNSSYEKCSSIMIILGSILIIITFIRLLHNSAVERQNIRETVLSIFNIILNCGILSMNCYLGQKIIDHSVIIVNKTFYIPWYVLSTKSQTLLLFMMMRSLKPCYFVLVNFLTLSVELSMTVIKTTLSYAMVIYSVK